MNNPHLDHELDRKDERDEPEWSDCKHCNGSRVEFIAGHSGIISRVCTVCSKESEDDETIPF